METKSNTSKNKQRVTFIWMVLLLTLWCVFCSGLWWKSNFTDTLLALGLNPQFEESPRLDFLLGTPCFQCFYTYFRQVKSFHDRVELYPKVLVEESTHSWMCWFCSCVDFCLVYTIYYIFFYFCCFLEGSNRVRGEALGWLLCFGFSFVLTMNNPLLTCT